MNQQESSSDQSTKLNIYQAMNKVMEELPAIPKNHKVAFGNTRYNFRGIDDIYQALQPLLIKYKVITIPEATLSHWERIETEKSVANRVLLSVRYTFYAEDGSSIVSCAIGEGIDSGDKASNKAMSAAHKYALLQAFCIPTEEPKDSELENHEIQKKSPLPMKTPTRTTAGPITAMSTTTMGAKLGTDPKEPWPVEYKKHADFRLTQGKWKGKSLNELINLEGKEKIHNYVSSIYAEANKSNRPIPKEFCDFIDAVKAVCPMAKEELNVKLARLTNEHPGETSNI